LKDVELNYVKIEKTAYVLLITARKLMSYFQAQHYREFEAT